MPELILPSILDLPDKLLPIITELDKYRYFLIEGGRGSGKSHSVARLMTYLSDQYLLRVFCGREIQNSIEESVYTLFKDLISEYNLNYNVGATKIDHNQSGSSIRFKGFREQGSVNIKGLEGVDILWIDEAQAITKETLDIIIPTIRKNNSKVFFTMNRTLLEDPVYVAMAGRADCLHIHIDYFENKHCPEVLKREAEECKKRDLDDYNHIWLGKPRDSSNKAVFRGVDYVIDRDLILPIEPLPEFSYTLGVDLARSIDFTVLTILNEQMKRVDYWERMDNENRTSWNYQKEKIKAISKKYNNALTVVDSTGVGDPIVEDLHRMGVNVFYQQKEDSNKTSPGVKFTNISKENLVEKLKVAIETRLIRIPFIKALVDELKEYEAILMPSGSYRYSAPEGKHDDCVMSLALALWGSHASMYEPKYEPPKKPDRNEEFWSKVKKDIAVKNNSNSYGQVEIDRDIDTDEGRELPE